MQGEPDFFFFFFCTLAFLHLTNDSPPLKFFIFAFARCYGGGSNAERWTAPSPLCSHKTTFISWEMTDLSSTGRAVNVKLRDSCSNSWLADICHLCRYPDTIEIQQTAILGLTWLPVGCVLSRLCKPKYKYASLQSAVGFQCSWP